MSDPLNDLKAPADLERILEIPLDVHVELGRRRMRISELLALDVGSVLDLSTPAGSPLSIYANRVLVARGEAVLVGDRYGVRITDIVPATERVRRLGGKETP
ncbi:MAG: FliM/FliN family flagellar motor switch protein [Sandaracinaceae bacterium]|nr:FliM/FliN family flagellar motor switch protein [Sandaracinaceae bacterium]